MGTLGSALRRLVTQGALVVMTGIVSSAGGQTLVDITNSPLYSSLQPHPNIVVAASVEFPTVAAAYISLNQVYDPTFPYQGYFDPARCYRYAGTLSTSSTAPSFADVPGVSTDGFSPAALADSTTHECSGGTYFSGSFMNWATMSAIDEFRYVMTGGNRIIDNPLAPAVLERAYLPDGNVAGVDAFYNAAAYFPPLALCDSTATGCGSPFPSLLSRVMPATIPLSGRTYVTNCRAVVYFSSTSPSGNCLPFDGSGNLQSGPSNNRGTYHVAVTVCDSVEGPVRIDLCQLYGSVYKPAGVAQQHAADMRFASFGYLMDRNFSDYTVPASCPQAPGNSSQGWNACRYGGVLRSPMKYLGAQSFNANQVPSTNYQYEINIDGTLRADPEGTALAAGGINSGFINYINKFGQTGLYKRYDTISELWYEGLRYLSGLKPTADATSGNYTNNVLDHYPLAYTDAARTKWADPLANQSICSANYIITIGDGQTNFDTYLPGADGVWNNSGDTNNTNPYRPNNGTLGVDEHGLNALLWTKRIGTLESSEASLQSGTGQAPINNNIVPTDYDPALGQLVNGDYQFIKYASMLGSGAAFWANVNDIRPDRAGTQTVKSIMVDTYAQENVPYIRRQLFLMAKYGGFNNTIDQASDTYPNPFYAADPNNAQGPAIRSNSEWADASGSASNYILASNPAKLITGIRSVFNRISATSGTTAGAALSASSLAYGASYAFLGTFDPKYWAGTVQAKQVSQSGGVVTVSSAASWDAGALLTAYCGGSPTTTNRCNEQNGSSRNLITTVRYGNGAPRSASPFLWYNGTGISQDPQLSTLFNTDPATGLFDNNGFYRIQFLRGDRRGESGPFLILPFTLLNFRARSSIMGDVVNSAPVYVAAPTTAIADADYLAFYNTYQNRTAAVYVGANDGMLHAFNAANGNELFGYVPNLVYYDLVDLTNPAYTHETFVDSTPAVKEAKVNGNWKTVLVSGVGNGGQGVFALDVTDPAKFGKPNVLFEFSDADDADMGNVLSSPEIVKLQTGTTGTPAVPIYGYFAAVTGYNNNRTTANKRADSSVSTTPANCGVLFLLSLDHALNAQKWTLKSDYYKYNFCAGSTATANGLGPVAALTARDGSGAAQALYFGDLQGDLWRLNTVGPPSAWTPSRGTVTAPLPLFVAVDGTVAMNRQPITVRPQIAIAPFNSQLVIFGTGKYLGNSDLSSPYAQQSEYVLLDNNQGAAITRASDLVPRAGTVTGTNVSITGAAFTYSGASSKKGWFIDLPSSSTVGERNITRAAVSNNLLSFTSLTLGSDVCGAGGGYVYQLNALTGLPYSDSLGNVLPGGALSTVGIPGPPQVVDLAISPGPTKPTGEQIGQKTSTTLVSGTSGNIAASQTNITAKAPPVGRVNWREVTNYNDRH